MATFTGRIKRTQYAKVSVEIDDFEIDPDQFTEAEIKDYILEGFIERGYEIGDWSWETFDQDVVYVNEKPEWG